MHMLNRILRLLSLRINHIRDTPINRIKSLQRHINRLNFPVRPENLFNVWFSDVFRQLFNDDFGGFAGWRGTTGGGGASEGAGRTGATAGVGGGTGV